MKKKNVIAEYISTGTAGAEIGYTAKTIERWIKSGRIEAKRIGRYYRIHRPYWENFKAKHLIDFVA